MTVNLTFYAIQRQQQLTFWDFYFGPISIFFSTSVLMCPIYRYSWNRYFRIDVPSLRNSTYGYVWKSTWNLGGKLKINSRGNPGGIKETTLISTWMSGWMCNGKLCSTFRMEPHVEFHMEFHVKLRVNSLAWNFHVDCFNLSHEVNVDFNGNLFTWACIRHFALCFPFFSFPFLSLRALSEALSWEGRQGAVF